VWLLVFDFTLISFYTETCIVCLRLTLHWHKARMQNLNRLSKVQALSLESVLKFMKFWQTVGDPCSLQRHFLTSTSHFVHKIQTFAIKTGSCQNPVQK